MAISRTVPSWRKASPEAVGLRNGFRSGLEAQNAKHLESHGIPVIFEKVKIKYVIPATERTYTPDFELPNGVIVETKGKFEPSDRAKHLFIKLEHPTLDIRFVFQKPQDKITKGSKVSYAMWAERHGFKWAAKVIPPQWWNEPGVPGARGPRTIAVPETAKDLLAGIARQPLKAGHRAALRATEVARPKKGTA